MTVVNILAFYSGRLSIFEITFGLNALLISSGTFFNIFSNNKNTAMYFSIGFGGLYLPLVYELGELNRVLGFLNFVFALPAIRKIDTVGRRRWLLITLPFMSLMMAAAALSFLALYNTSIQDAPRVTCALVVTFLYCKCCTGLTLLRSEADYRSSSARNILFPRTWSVGSLLQAISYTYGYRAYTIHPCR